MPSLPGVAVPESPVPPPEPADPEVPDPEVPDPDVPVPDVPVPGSVGVDPAGGVLVPVAGGEAAGLPDGDGCGDVVAWAGGVALGVGEAGSWAGCAFCAGALTLAGHGDAGAEKSRTVGAGFGYVTPGCGGAAPISAACAAGLAATEPVPDPVLVPLVLVAPVPAGAAELAVAGLVPEPALAGPGADPDDEARCPDWHPEPRCAPGARAAEGRPPVPPAAGSAGASGRACPAPPVPVPSRPAAGVPASTVELACTSAPRSGPTETAKAAESASAAPASAGPSRYTGRGAGRPPGREKRARRRGRPHGARRPRQVHALTRSASALITVTNHGRGGRSLIRARIFSSPSNPGSTPATASESACRSTRSRSSSSSGKVMPSPARPQRHDVSCSRILDLRAAIPRAVWLFTAPLVMPIVLAISASEKSP